MYLWIEEGAEDSNGSSKGIDWSNRSVKDDDGRDYHGYAFHGVAYTEC